MVRSVLYAVQWVIRLQHPGITCTEISGIPFLQCITRGYHRKVKILDKKGSGILSISAKYLRHRLLARHRNGYGVHSPFLYDLVRNVIFNKYGWQVPEEVQSYHHGLCKNETKLHIQDHGAGSRITGRQERSVASIAKRSSVTRRQGALLYRLAKWYRPAAVIEAGTGIGISTSYLASGAVHAGLTTIEGSPAKYNFAREHTGVYGAGGLEFLLGTFDEYFERLVEKTPDRTLFFIDGDHRYLPTMQRVRAILAQERFSVTLVILDDIHWSDEMERAWKEACAGPGVNISLDLFHLGILIRRPGIARQHFRISF
jgi:predicted O-methyltransferase YrrM